GQLAVLYAAANPGAVDGLVLVAAGTAYFAGFTGLGSKLSVLGRTQLVGALSRAYGYWPGERFDFAGAQPGRLMRDWARSARTGRYVVDGVDFDTLVARLRTRVLAVSVAGDELAPASSMDHLCGKLRSARVDRWHHAPNGSAPGHLRWARDPDGVADHVAGWLAGVPA